MSQTRTRKRSRKPTEPGWWWVEGLRKLSGVKVWVPLYCSRTEAEAQQTLRVVEAHATRRIEVVGDKHAEREAAQVGAYRAFRVVPDSEQGVRCSECTSNYLKRIKRGDERLWKCLNCLHTWVRTPQETFTTQVNEKENPSEAPVSLQERRKLSSKGDEAPRRRSGRQKKPQGPVRNGQRRRKIR